MRRGRLVRPLAAGIAMFAASSLSGFIGSTANAAIPSHSTVGTYNVTVMWTHPPFESTFGMTLRANHQVSSSSGFIGEWSIRQREITITGNSVTFEGKKTSFGFFGTMRNTGGNRGTWAAEYRSAP